MALINKGLQGKHDSDGIRRNQIEQQSCLADATRTMSLEGGCAILVRSLDS